MAGSWQAKGEEKAYFPPQADATPPGSGHAVSALP